MACTTEAIIEVTTSEDPTLEERLGVLLTDREQWLSAIDEELTPVQDKAAWVENYNHKSQALPRHVILKVRGDEDETFDRF